MDRADGRALEEPPHVVIIGGGFGGLYAARALRRAPARITVIDRRNHHLFQPLLYQVATASLSPADIAAPIRHVLARQDRTEVLLAEARAIDVSRRLVMLDDGAIDYDYLIVATGATHSYFGHDEWSRHALGLKDVPDALAIRERFLLAFEEAERETDAERRRACLTFVIIGAGPTGVELAGAIAEIARRGLHRDFRRIDPATARVILIEGRDRVLPAFDPRLSARAQRDLKSMGVELRLQSLVSGVDAGGVWIGGERIAARTMLWAAGVRASSIGATLGAPMDSAGRVLVLRDCSLPGRPEVFVIGDLASLPDGTTGQTITGIAPVAMQMGRFVARVIHQEVQAKRRGETPRARPTFRYRDRGMLATIGRARAVGTVGRMHFAGPLAWLLWLVVHILYLLGFRNRLIVLIQWAWAYFTFQRGARLITGARATRRERDSTGPDTL